MSGSASSSDVPRVFVSHSHEDDRYCHDFVAELRALLGSADAVWYDEHNLGSGELLTEIQRQLHARTIFVVVLSKAALHRSTWVADECRWAFQLRQREPTRVILPVCGAPIETGDFYPDWMYLEGFKRIEAPGMQPFPAQEAARRAYSAITGMAPPVHSAAQQPPSAPAPTPAPAPAASQHPARTPTMLPRDRFPARLEQLGFTAWSAVDPATGMSVPFILPPLCPVPAGPFLMGSDPQQDSQAQANEQPQHEVTLPAYQIAKFPVTVAEYACLVATGHAPPGDWSKQQNKMDHPIVNVSWSNARDYAAWLAGLTGQPWALPSEAEWEKAARWDARGDSGRGVARIYPWGNEFDKARCTTGKWFGGTAAVGTYGPENPAHDGSSPCGAQDMAGNVWEWTRTIYDAQAYSKKTSREDADSTENRVLRGGSWSNDSRSARAAHRHGTQPGYAFGSFGFRVSLPSAVPSSF